MARIHKKAKPVRQRGVRRKSLSRTQTRTRTKAQQAPIFPGHILKSAFRPVRDFIVGALFLLAAAASLVAIVTYHPMEPSINAYIPSQSDGGTVIEGENALGYFGASLADILLQFLGESSFALCVAFAVHGIRLMSRKIYLQGIKLFTLHTIAIFFLANGLGFLNLSQARVYAGAGGVIGNIIPALLEKVGIELPLLLSWLAALSLFLLFVIFFSKGLGLSMSRFSNLFQSVIYRGQADKRFSTPFSERQSLQAKTISATSDTPKKKQASKSNISRTRKRRTTKAAGLIPGNRHTILNLDSSYILPDPDLLEKPKRKKARLFDATTLEENARKLEMTLNDFGVHGEIIEVRPGPVVTMYELVPARGVKTSRVIALSDDIARTMSAVSARVAVIPGRNVIGIELPNPKRDHVVLHELIKSPVFQNDEMMLPMIIGKDISGACVVADLAPMPHLLIAGTTGAGKSVGLNSMIISILYRHSPIQCRLILIDPKMLELSIYEGIPHLLTPVVTEPKKAIAALKWAVREMEERYRKMTSINAKSLSHFNEKVIKAQKSGKPLIQKSNTGYDHESGQPIYEENQYEYDPMPMIVIVVDEFGDLMLVAGKEIEILIQRLAQKARAAGIHLIMATQRPSVDVITGVIKANLPTRISFAVTSKIDSRTILGDQGAEQLLGKGDMLYMRQHRISRVHGPLVTEVEVERVADHWRSQGAPDYVDEVTSDDDENQFQGSFFDGNDNYARALEVIARTQRVSTSFIQRQLSVGYNTAATIVEKMEEEGFISAADRQGRREVLIDENGNRRL